MDDLELPESVLKALTQQLHKKIPNSELSFTTLPHCPNISLWLLDANYPQWRLTHEQAADLMDKPPFWSFCWASGQVLAAQLLQNPQWVKGKSLLDFGAGSGVVAIAAKMAGADEVWVCDQDPNALLAAKANALANGVALNYCSDLENSPKTQVITVADVFYDRDNLPLLTYMQEHFSEILMADCRLKGEPLPGLTIIDYHRSHTVPDLSESDEFNNVYVYRSQPLEQSLEDAPS